MTVTEADKASMARRERDDDINTPNSFATAANLSQTGSVIKDCATHIL
jgi:hypothetical protein